MARKVADCRDMPSEKACTLTISGEEDEVVRAAVMHAVDWHGHQDTPEFREEVRGMLKPESGMERGAERGERDTSQPAQH